MKKILLFTITISLLLPHKINAAELTVNELDNIIQTPQLQINIPGLDFTGGVDIIENNDGSTYVKTDFFQQYLVAVYKYSVVAISILAVIMIIFAGIQWLTSGGSPDRINAAKKRIGGSIIGIVLAVGSYTILYTINPYLTSFKSLDTEYIPPDIVEPTSGEFDGMENGTLANITMNNNVPHFGQCYKDWKLEIYGRKTICEAGCGMVSLSMVLTFYKDYIKPEYKDKTQPYQLAAEIRKFHPAGTASNFNTLHQAAETYGLTKLKGIDEKTAQNYLKNGLPIIANVKNKNRENIPYKGTGLTEDQKEANRKASTCLFTTGGHYIVLTGYDENTKIYSINDPARSNPPDERKWAKAEYLKNDCQISYFFTTVPNLNLNFGQGKAKAANKCTFTENRWNTNTNSSQVYRTENATPYDALIASDPNYVSKVNPSCSICEEDQTTISISGKTVKVCSAYAEQIKKILDQAISNGFIIESLTGYRPLRSAGTKDANGFYTGVGGHFYGMAIDINASSNGLYNNCKSWDPINNPKGPLPSSCVLKGGGAWDPITKPNKSIYYGSTIYNGFTNAGWKWGGKDMGDGSQRDIMDFSIYGYDFSTQ